MFSHQLPLKKKESKFPWNEDILSVRKCPDSYMQVGGISTYEFDGWLVWVYREEATRR